MNIISHLTTAPAQKTLKTATILKRKVNKNVLHIRRSAVVQRMSLSNVMTSGKGVAVTVRYTDR